MPNNGVILVVTDAGTKQRELEETIIKKSTEKNIKIFIAFYPKCWDTEICERSMPSYERVSEMRIFTEANFDSGKIFEDVVYMVSRMFYMVRNYPQIQYAIPPLITNNQKSTQTRQQ